MTEREPEQPGTLKEVSQGGRSQSHEWATVHTLAWKHDIAKGGKTPFYHSVRFTPTRPVKHAICPRHRSSCSHIGCDRTIHTRLPIRHHLLQKKKNKVFATLAQWQAVRQRASTPTGPQLRGCPCGGREQRPEVMVGGAAQPWTHLMPSPGGDSFPHFNKMPKQKTKPGILIIYLQKLVSPKNETTKHFQIKLLSAKIDTINKSY